MNDSDSENDDKMVSSMSHDSTPGGGEKQVDLFSEIHLNQMKKLEGERNSLTKSLKEIQDLSDKSKGQVVLLQAALTTIVSHIDALNSLKEKTSQKMVDGKTPKVFSVLLNIENSVENENSLIFFYSYSSPPTKVGTQFPLRKSPS